MHSYLVLLVFLIQYILYKNQLKSNENTVIFYSYLAFCVSILIKYFIALTVNYLQPDGSYFC